MNKRLIANFLFLLPWLGVVTGLVLSFDLMTTTLSRFALLFVTIYAVGGLWRRQYFPALMLGLFSLILIISYWVSVGAVGIFAAVTLVFAATLLTGLAAYGFVYRFRLTDALSWEDWILLGFITAQLCALIIYLPVSFFEKTLYASLAFYGFWLWLDRVADGSVKEKWAHFVYLGGLAILISGEVIWANLPQLRIF